MSKRGIRRVSTRVRLAVAAAVLVGGGAAAAVAVTSGGGATSAASAGYYQQSGQYMSYMDAMSSALNNWNRSWTGSLETISHMQKMSTVNITKWHHKVFVMQRGIVVKILGHGSFLVKSSNGHYETWQLTGGTKTVNVGGLSTGWDAMTGNTLQTPSWWNMNNMNTTIKGIAVNDLVFVFGQREHNVNKAELVLFAAQNTTTNTNTNTNTNTYNGTFNGTNTNTNTGTTGGTSTTTINGQSVVTGTHS